MNMLVKFVEMRFEVVLLSILPRSATGLSFGTRIRPSQTENTLFFSATTSKKLESLKHEHWQIRITVMADFQKKKSNICNNLVTLLKQGILYPK